VCKRRSAVNGAEPLGAKRRRALPHARQEEGSGVGLARVSSGRHISSLAERPLLVAFHKQCADEPVTARLVGEDDFFNFTDKKLQSWGEMWLEGEIITERA
jgi:hypothetical protein